jgi:hypothetical protein
VTERKRLKRSEAAVTRSASEVSPPDEPEKTPEAPGSPRRSLSGWFGLVIRVCVYVTFAVCVELLLAAYERFLEDSE